MGMRFIYSIKKNMKGYYGVLIAVVVFACSGSKTEQETKVKPVGSRCYRYTDGRDTILLSFQEENSLILGELEYKFFEKDKSSGGIRGVMINDTIFAEYDFYAEGKKSTREVAFLKRDSVLMEGFGKTSMLNDKEVFDDKKALQFDSKIFLSEVACQ
jgi:hypothetical protein